MAINGHARASGDSQRLCHSLYLELSQLIPDLLENPTKGSCGLYQKGKARFAYVYHSKTMPQVEVWCRGDKGVLVANDPGLGVRARDNPKAGWGESFPIRFRIHTENQAALAASFLAEFSWPAATPKKRRRAP